MADLASSAFIIVMCLDDTDGILWEIEHLVTCGHLHKTLFLVHPKFAHNDANRRFLTQVSTRLGRPGRIVRPGPVPSAGKKGQIETILGFFYGVDGLLRIIRSSTFSQLAYLLALRLFLHQRMSANAVS